MSVEFKVVVAILAAYRLTVLLCTDEGPFAIMRRTRDFFAPYTALLMCPHCTGVWCAMAMFICISYDWLMWIPLILGIAGGQSFMESCLEKKWKILDE